MGLLSSKVLEPLKDYISFKDFFQGLSVITNDNVYDVATFLLNIDFAKNIDLYIIDSAYKIHRSNSLTNRDKLNKNLSNLQTVFLFNDFIFTQENYQNLEVGENKRALIDCLANPYDTMQWYFKKQDLADFEPLQGLVNFLNVSPTPKQYPLIYKNDYFDLSECESVITGFDPSDNWQCSEREQAHRLINSSLNNGLFQQDQNNNYFISADNFRKWLKNKDIFIEGFSDITPNVQADTVEQPTTNQNPSQPKQSNSNNNHIIEEIISKADIVKIIGKHTELKQSGNQLKGCCPFHSEKTPSFFVNPQKNLYHCFGCGAKGNALTFLKEYEHITAGEALKELSRQTGIELPKEKDNSNSTLKLDTSDLEKRLETARETYKTQQTQIAQLEKENAELQTKITELENNKANKSHIGVAPFQLIQANHAKAKAESDLTTANERIKKLEKQLNEQLEAGTLAEPIADNPSYTTTAITALNHVITEFWQDWKQGMTPPKQNYIVRWITDNYPEIKPTMAERIDRIARHDSLRPNN